MVPDEFFSKFEDYQVARLKGDLVFEFPQSYSTKEHLDIFHEAITAESAALNAAKDSFAQLSSEHQEHLLDTLVEESDMSREQWIKFLK